MSVRTLDASFSKYEKKGAYHWREISSHLLQHNAFTAERYRRTIAGLQPLQGKRVLDYGCGDGALLGLLCRAVDASGEAHGFDPNELAIKLCNEMMQKHKLQATLHGSKDKVPLGYFDAVICAEVIEHVTDVPGLLNHIAALLKLGGRVIFTTPIRLTETPVDPNHVQEWFPTEFAAVIKSGPFRIIQHEEWVPVAAPEFYWWRPWFFLRFPLVQVLCNVFSVFAGKNILSALKFAPKYFMTQMVLAERVADPAKP